MPSIDDPSRRTEQATAPTTDEKSGNVRHTINARQRPLRALCVSIHDVAPETWPRCRQLLHAIEAVATIPVTLLVVPAYHRHVDVVSRQYDAGLERCLCEGNELALHGFTHVDDAQAPTRWRERFLRRIYTLGEGEFSAIDFDEARMRLDQGLAWFVHRGWPVEGFVAPAWLLGEGAWQALRQFHFSYTTTLPYFYRLPDARALFSPSLVYLARNATGRLVSQRVNSMAAQLLQDATLVRLSLHPADAGHPQLILHMQRLLRHCLTDRTAMTKADFVHAW